MEGCALPSSLCFFKGGGVCAPLLRQEKIALTCYKSCSISLTRSNILSSSEKTNVEYLTPWLKYKHRKKMCIKLYHLIQIWFMTNIHIPLHVSMLKLEDRDTTKWSVTPDKCSLELGHHVWAFTSKEYRHRLI